MRMASGIFLILAMGCATGITIKATPEMEQLYPNWHEISYCLDSDMIISNIVEGNFAWVYLAACNQDEVVIHTHPWWGDRYLNPSDYSIFKQYRKLYGNRLYGIQYNSEEYVVYTID